MLLLAAQIFSLLLIPTGVLERIDIWTRSFFPCGTNCHADLNDSKRLGRHLSVRRGKSVHDVLDVHANTAPRELEAMLRRYVDDWLRLTPQNPTNVSRDAQFRQWEAS